MQHNVIRLIPRHADEFTDRAVYTVPEVARLLSLSRGSAYACVRDGTIPAIRVGGRWVIPKRRFHTWLNGLTENRGN